MRIKAKLGGRRSEEAWELSGSRFYYCATHGKCPAVIGGKLSDGAEIIKHMGPEPLFYCEQCSMVKVANTWGDSSNLCEAQILA